MNSFLGNNCILFRHILPTLCLLIASSMPLLGQDHLKEVKKQAELMSQALVRGEYSSYVKRTYPGLVAALGGEEKMISGLEKRAEGQKQEGVTLEAVRLNTPAQLTISGSDWYTTIVQIQTFKVKKGGKKDKGGWLESPSTLLALSTDGGSSWYFIDTATLPEKELRALLPSLPKEFKLPSRQLPVFVPN
ncbi:hypothetical protein Q0590_36080 [Rhodocytophaga aerolata]|uniref:Uncharacterized protein n=1 Tax=Rhodocytophaga aerolata TaxID=455078 RepID=A0ABT8RJT8_9BACT|nr:hypothetical protein [Rhodocytophaga aerolata]MDO1451749.1 hypothetical protein [Rhodocytophaga aerolata]